MIIQSRRVWIDDAFQAAQIRTENGKIQEILSWNTEKPDVDYGEHMILPGFIDAHTHGCVGIDSATADVKDMEVWQKAEAAEGVTSFMATTATESEEDNQLQKAMEVLSE